MKAAYRFVGLLGAVALGAFGLALVPERAPSQGGATYTNHGVIVGRGPGVVGFGVVTPGTTGQVLTAVTGGDPVWGTGGGGTSVLTANHMFLGNGSNVATDSTVGGDCTASLVVSTATLRCIGTSTNGQLLSNSSGAIAGVALPLTVANGGTGITSGSTGGVPYFSAAGTMASSATLTANALVIGGGAGTPPSVVPSLGTTTTLLHGNGSGAPSWAAVTLTTDVTGTLPAANGGTGNASYTVGDLLYASGATALSKLAGVATGNALISGGVATAPSWGKIGLTTHVNGVLPVANGGTNASSASGTALDNITGFSSTGFMKRTGAGTYTFNTASQVLSDICGVQGDLLYFNGTSWVCLATDTDGKVLTTHGAGANPTWTAVAGTGTVTSVVCGTGLDGGTITTTGTCSLSAARRTLPTTQRLTSGTNATYTTPANALWLEVYVIGAGGGGAGGGSSGGGTGGNGGETCFKASGTACTTPLFGSGGGTGADWTAGNAGTGGTIDGAQTGTCNDSMTGGSGQVNPSVAANFNGVGGAGGQSRRTGAGSGSKGNAAGENAQANSGSGGQGGGTFNAVVSTAPGMGGGAGAHCYAIVQSPAATYVYTIGAGGAGGSAGTNGQAGGNGGSGVILVIEHYGT